LEDEIRGQLRFGNLNSARDAGKRNTLKKKSINEFFCLVRDRQRQWIENELPVVFLHR
jgi:hypothetical protein